MSLQIQADRTLIRRSAQSVRHLLVTLEAPITPLRARRPAVNLSFVVDCSGSMSGDKLERACEAVLHALNRLGPEDRFSVVDYADDVFVTTESTPANNAAKLSARERVLALRPRGSTNLSGGWLKGCEQIASHLDEEGIARCLLLTDGLANRGITDPEELVGHATALRRRGIATSTFGVGADFDEHLLGAMAERGGGSFHFLGNAEAIPLAMDQELGEALEVVARDACLRVDAPGVEVSSLNDFPTRVEHGCTVIELGPLVSGQVLQAVIALRFPTGETGQPRSVTVSVTDRGEALPPLHAGQVFTHAPGADVAAQPRRREVDRVVAAVHAARACRRALEMNRRGDYQGAGDLLARCRERVASYAGDDAELQRIVGDLEGRCRELSARMDALSSKARYRSTMSSMKSRSGTSASLRRLRGRHFALITTTFEQQVAAATAVGKLQVHLSALGLSARQCTLDVAPLQLIAPLSHGAEFELATKVMECDRDAGMRIVFTPHALRDAWFSHAHHSMAAVVVSTSAAEYAHDVSLPAFIAYEMLLHGLQLASPYYDLESLLHEDERGCLYDLCRDHRRLAYKLDAMGICNSCRTLLGNRGIDVARVDAASAEVAVLQRQACVSAY